MNQLNVSVNYSIQAEEAGKLKASLLEDIKKAGIKFKLVGDELLCESTEDCVALAAFLQTRNKNTGR